MDAGNWRLSAYDIALTGASLHLAGAGHRFLYAAEGGLDLVAGEYRIPLAAGEGAFLEPDAVLTGSGTAWLFETAPADNPLLDHAAVSVALSRRIRLPAEPCIMRADRVESQAGAVTPTHHHRGPGIRRLVQGLLLAKIGDQIERISPGMAWFETGHEMVVGRNISGGINAFVRVMLLPQELFGGKSSFIPANPTEELKPRAASLRLFGERLIN